MRTRLALVILFALASTPVYSQSIRTDENIETEGQFVSEVATGTPPLIVTSKTKVDNLNVDRIDGRQSTDLALAADLQSLEAMLAGVETQVDLARGEVPLARTGQAACYDEAGAVVSCGTGTGVDQDGDLQLGTAWPDPRFTNNGDGTVTDHLTDLVWLEDADCFGLQTWTASLAAANALFDGSTNDPMGGDCGLLDGSIEGEWRLPNVRELASLVHHGVANPALPDTVGTGQWSAGDPFAEVQSDDYWSSTSGEPASVAARLDLTTGTNTAVAKTTSNRMWPVRGSSRIPRTGQASCFDEAGAVVACGSGIGLGQDGHLQAGVAWPSPRFTRGGDGTVTDNLSGLVWLENANCFNSMTWEDSLAAAAGLFDGSTNGALGDDCGLSDGSVAGDWRVPNANEIMSLMNYGVSAPAVPDTSGVGQSSTGDPFADILVGAVRYWTSTTHANSTALAKAPFFESGLLIQTGKSVVGFTRLWPVRGGE